MDQAGKKAQESGSVVTFQTNFVFELAEKAHKGIDDTGNAASQLAKSSALRAFRATVISGKSHLPHPAMNSAGNLRGMVISKRARYIYNISSNIAEKFEKYDSALAFAGIIIEIGKETDTITHIAKGNMSTGEKVRQVDLIVSTAILRSVTGVVPAGAHILAKSLEGYCQIAGVLSGGQLPTDKWIGKLREADVNLKTFHQKVLSPEFVQHLGDAAGDMIYAHLHVN